MIDLVEISDRISIQNKELLRRANESTKSRKTIQYLAFSNDREIAFVSIDRWQELDKLVIYELFVPTSLRNKGVGRSILLKIEEVATNEGFSIVSLNPSPLEPEIDRNDLIAWYKKSGYVPDTEDTGDLVKFINSSPTKH